MKNKLTTLKTLVVLLAMALTTAAAAQCQASFTYSFSGPNVVFTNTSTGASMPIYSWNFGDNTSSSQANPTHAYNTTGVFNVCLTLWDSANLCQSSYCDTITVSSACGMTISASTTGESVCGACDGSASLTVTGGQAPYTYAWSTGATTSSVSSLCHSSYWVTVTDANNCAVTNYPVYISCPQQNSCQASFTTSVTGFTATFTNTSTGTMLPMYIWDFGDNTTSTATNPVHSYNAPGIYSVFLQLYDSISGCQSMAYDSVVVMYGCGMNLNLSATNETNCGDHDGSITTALTGGTAPFSYAWSNSSTTASISGLGAGYYYVTVTDSTGCIINGGATITCPQQSCQAQFTSSFILANTVVFTNTSTANSSSVTYYWNFGDATSYSGANPPQHYYGTPGVYVVTLSMADSIGPCFSTFTDSIYVNSAPACGVGFQMIQDSINPLYWYVFPSVTGTAPFTYLWDFGDNSTSTLAYPTHNYAMAGQYTVCLTITDANNCTSTFCDSSSVQRLHQGAPQQLQMQFLTVMNPTIGIIEQTSTTMQVAPNPANDRIQLSMSENIDGTVRITGLAGNIISEQRMTGNQLSVDVSMLPAGSYNITVTSGNSNWNQRVVIVR